MTEKNYGGSTSHGFKEATPSESSLLQTTPKTNSKKTKNNSGALEVEAYEKAGAITKQVVEYAKTIVKKDIPLLQLATKIESKILELGGKPAFPVNLSINEIAAHDTPSYNDERKAHGLIKVDIGVHIEGYGADTAFSVDLENKEINKQLTATAESALAAALKIVNTDATLGEVGAIIESTITKAGFEPVRNLSGHSIDHYDLHAGVTVPNYDTKQVQKFNSGVYAIEPFVTNGVGSIRDSKPSGIYQLIKEGAVRDVYAREVLAYILEEYQTLPFCARWLVTKFGTRALLALKRIEDAGLLHHYAQLVEKGNGIVAQAEHTVLITESGIKITTQ